MRVVLDTNTLVAGVIGRGPPRTLIDAAKARIYPLYTSETLLAELLDVLTREKFAVRLRRAQLTARDIVDDVRRIGLVVNPSNVPRVVAADPDDDHVLACALAVGAQIVVSGDKHLLRLGSFQDIAMVKAAEAVKVLGI